MALNGDMAVDGGWSWRVAGEVFGACSLSPSLDGSLAGGILLIFSCALSGCERGVGRLVG